MEHYLNMQMHLHPEQKHIYQCVAQTLPVRSHGLLYYRFPLLLERVLFSKYSGQILLTSLLSAALHADLQCIIVNSALHHFTHMLSVINLFSSSRT